MDEPWTPDMTVDEQYDELWTGRGVDNSVLCNETDDLWTDPANIVCTETDDLWTDSANNMWREPGNVDIMDLKYQPVYQCVKTA